MTASRARRDQRVIAPVGAAPPPSSRGRHRGEAPGSRTRDVDAASGWRADTGPFGDWERDSGEWSEDWVAFLRAGRDSERTRRASEEAPPAAERARAAAAAAHEDWRTDTSRRRIAEPVAKIDPADSEDWRVAAAGRANRRDGTGAHRATPGQATAATPRGWRADTGTGEWGATGEWPTTEWTRAGRAAPRPDRRSATGQARPADASAGDRRADTNTGRDRRADAGTGDRRVDASTGRDWRADTGTGDRRADTGTSRDWRADTGTPDAAAAPGTGQDRRAATGGGRAPAAAGTGEWATGSPLAAAPGGAPASGTAAVRLSAPPATLPRLLAAVRPDGRPVPLDEHVRSYGFLPPYRHGDPDGALLALIADSRLRGRGGAGFPVEAKVRAVLAARGRPVVVANGAASDPLSEKDAFLLSRLPHLVLDGAQVAAAAVAARQVLLYVVGRPQVYGAVERAVAERRRAGVDAVSVKLIPAPDRYVAGESSAVTHDLSGGPALPLFQPPHTAEHGVKGRPTLVQNVETLANLALLARYGAGWFRGVGTSAEPGSLVVTVRGAVPRPVVIEVPVGTTVEQALVGAGWLTEPIGAVQVGGCFGRWLVPSIALSAPLSHAGMLAVGGTLGAGVVIALPDRACGLDETARLARYLAGESAGQCGACVNGLPAIADSLTALAEGRADALAVQRLHRWCAMVAGRGACRHPDGVTALVASGLAVFAEDVRRHLSGWCGRSLRGVLPVPPPATAPTAARGRA